MERLLVLKLDVQGCEAEALLNGVPVARADAARPRVVVPVHEYTLAGNNRLELVLFPRPAAEAAAVAPPAESYESNGLMRAHVRILLPRTGSPADEASARSLAELDWAPPEGEAVEAPSRISQDVNLPVSFPRWRWMDAPPAPAGLEAKALEFVKALVEDLGRGQVDSFLTACRLRTEELALAYQREPLAERDRLREALYASAETKWLTPDSSAFALRPLAGGRLLECLNPDGTPALQSEPDAEGRRRFLPLRLAWVENRFYVLR